MPEEKTTRDLPEIQRAPARIAGWDFLLEQLT
jgi:hypothetical protein